MCSYDTRYEAFFFYTSYKKDITLSFFSYILYYQYEKQTKKVIGALIATQAEKENVFDMAILIDKKSRRNGYMSEALLTFISAIPKESTLKFVVDKTNAASLRTVSKLPNLQSKSFKNDKYTFLVTA